MPTRSVCASVRAAVPDSASWELRASFQASEPSPNSDVTSPVGSVVTVPKTDVFAACAVVSGVVSAIPVPAAPAVPTAAMVADSSPTVIVWPTMKPLTLATLMFVSPAAVGTRSAVGPPVIRTALLFSSSMFAAETPPTEQPAPVNVSHGAGVVWPPSLTMFGSGSLAPATVLFQYLNDDAKAGIPFDW